MCPLFQGPKRSETGCRNKDLVCISQILVCIPVRETLPISLNGDDLSLISELMENSEIFSVDALIKDNKIL